MSTQKEPISIRHYRIGNILNYKGKPHYVSFLSLDIDDEYEDQIGVVELGKTSNEISGWNREEKIYDYLEPIPLTEERLLKMGFFLKEQIATENFYGCALFQDRNSDEFVIPYEGSYHYIRDISSSDYDGSTEYRTTTIQFVHQLQNLYFALTGEELKFEQ